MKNIYVIILNYNGGKDTIDCIRSIQKSTRQPADKIQNWKILIIDNKSQDDSLIQLKKTFPKIEIIENKINKGFAGGVNTGIKEALKRGAEYILLLNNDTVAENDFVTPLITYLENNESIGIVSPVIKYKKNGKLLYDLGGKVNWGIGRTKHLEIQSFKDAKTQREEKIDYVSGCCMMVRREVFEKIGLFDERFFLYFEDVDFCLRARKAGFGISVVKDSIINHKLSGSFGNDGMWKFRENIKSNWKFIDKYLGWRKIFGFVYIFLLVFKGLTLRRVRPSKE